MHALTKARQQLEAFRSWMAEKVAPYAGGVYPLELAEWQRELDLIGGQIDSPDRIRIALIGSTGAGKSTFLNAVLGQVVLPVSVMQPCTAFVTLVRKAETHDYSVEVDFASRAEWDAEVETFAACLSPGDDGEGDADGESKRLIESAKKRLLAVLGDAVNDAKSRDDLLAIPIPNEALRIFSGESVAERRFGAAADMLDYLQKLIRGESALWPLVKQVSIRGPYDCLDGGLELVDLPGLNDPNAARVEVTREFLRTSPFVWVMFPMVRGLTQDIQIILGQEKLLRTLVFAGTYSALSLIGTKADVVDNDTAPQLGLDEDCETADLIREYRRQTEIEAREQLVQMVRDMATPADAGETLDRMLNLAGNISVHTTSASAYMKIRKIGRLRRDYGLERVEDTGIPGVHDHLRKIAREAGAEFNAAMALKRLNQLGEEVAFFFRSAAQASAPHADQTRQRIRVELDKFLAQLTASRAEAKIKLDVYRDAFHGRLTPMLHTSVQGVQRVCQMWGGIHWATVRAIVQRDGVFKSPSTGKFYDLNGDLTDPLLSQLPVTWEHYFTDDLGRVVDVFVTKVTEAGTNFCERVNLTVELSLGRQDPLLGEQLAWFQSKISLLAQASQSRLMAAVTGRRTDLAVRIPAVAKNYMAPAYGDAKAESGPGMKNRMLATLSHVAVKSAPPIYETIQTDLLEGLNDLDAVILGLFDELVGAATTQARQVVANAAIDIDTAILDAEAQAILAAMPLAVRQ